MPLEVFYSYAHEDEALRDALEKHLSLLRRSGHVVSWHDRCIGAGDEWREEIDAHARSAQIILLLISPDFVASDYCYDVEMKLALERHARHDAIVIPIILRPVDWSGAPFAPLQALPRDGKAVTTWSDRDEAFANVAQGIRDVVARFGPPVPATKTGDAVLVDMNAPKSRVLDAAVPSRIVKDQTTELQVLIRLPDSPGLKGILLADEEAEAKPEDVLSKEFKVAFPLGPNGRPEALRVKVQLTSPDFNPPKQAKQFFVPADEDSEVVSFLLTPLRIGKLKVLVELQWKEALRGVRRLLTECVAEAASATNAVAHVVRIPVEVGTETSGNLPASLTDAPREFTDFFGPGPGATIGERPRETTIDLFKVPKKSQRNTPGEFTQLFGSGKSGDPAPPLPDLVVDIPRQDEPAALRKAEPPEPAGATGVFSVARPPLSSPTPLPTGPGEYTRITSGGTSGSTSAEKLPIAAPKAPAPPKFSSPALPSAPKAQQNEAPRARISCLPLVIILSVLLFFAILLIAYFAIKH